jgi:hypothetical protein
MHHYSINAYAVVNLHLLLFLYTLTMSCIKPKHVAVGFISEFKLCLINLFVYRAFVFIFDSFGKEWLVAMELNYTSSECLEFSNKSRAVFFFRHVWKSHFKVTFSIVQILYVFLCESMFSI